MTERKRPAPSVLGNELGDALRSCERVFGLRGDALMALLQEFRAGAFYPEGQRPRHGLTVDGRPIEVHAYIALRDLDRAFAKWRARPAAGGVDAWLDAYIVRSVRARNKGLPKARAARAEKQRQRASFDHAEWRSIAAGIWRDDIGKNKDDVAAAVRVELARRHGVPDTELPAVETIASGIKGVKGDVKIEKARASLRSQRR